MSKIFYESYEKSERARASWKQLLGVYSVWKSNKYVSFITDIDDDDDDNISTLSRTLTV